jgi:uroporphyrinogen decarboxylase
MAISAMTPRERVMAAISHQALDRVPTDIWATPEVTAKLEAHLGKDWQTKLHIDGWGGSGPKYIGPALPHVGPGESVDYWGIRRKKIDYGTGAYDEISHYPLAAAQSIDDLRQYNWPKAEWFDFSVMAEPLRGERAKNKAIQCGYMAPFYFHNLTRGLEQSLMDGLIDEEFTHYLVGRISEFFLDYHRAMFASCPGLIDVTQVTDDLGMQTGPLISLGCFRTFYKPHMRKMIDLAHSFGIKVFHHDDGAMRVFLPDLVEMGIDILNPIQWRCPGMDRKGLKADFGKQLCFHGALDNQHTLPRGSVEDVRAEARENIDMLASDKTGFIFGPCHAIQAVTPVENIVAMYDEAWNYGKF